MTKRKKTTKRRKPTTPWRRFRLFLRRQWRRSRWLLLAVGVLCCLSLKPAIHYFREFTRPVRRTVVASTGYNGIDVSKYQGNIDWKKVAADRNIQFVYIKATEGATKADTRYEEYLRKARAEGLKVGSYHFFVSFRTAEQQFANFKRHVSRSKQDLIPMVDVEEAGNRTAKRTQLQRELQRFMELVRKEYGHYPLLYSQYSFYNQMLAPEFNRYYIFIARYGKHEPLLRGGGMYDIWQYSEKGHINGIKGTVDLDRFAKGRSLNDILM